MCQLKWLNINQDSSNQNEVDNVFLCGMVNDSIILVDRKKVIYANASTSNMFEIDELKPKNLRELMPHVHPKDCKAFESLINAVENGKQETGHCQFRVKQKNGTTRWVWCRVFPVFPESTRMVMLNSDITEMREREERLKQTEIAVRTAEEKYKVLTSLLPEMVFETNLEGQLLFVNLKAIYVFEYGSDFYVKNLKFIELISSDERLKCFEELKKFISSKTEVSEIESAAVTKSGRKFPVMLHITKMYNQDGQLSGLNILMLDRTAQKNVENYQENMAFLSKSALNFLTLSSDDDIYIFVGKSLSKFASKSVVTVFSYDHNSDISTIRYISGLHSRSDELIEILGDPPEKFDIKLSEGFKSRYLTDKTLKKVGSLKNIVEHEKAVIIEKMLNLNYFYTMGIERNGILYGGLLIAAKDDSNPIDTQTIETFIYQAGIALHRKQIDNELVRAKMIAEESDRLKSAFLANMSHELRTPLNGILGLAQVMMNSEGNETIDFTNSLKMIVDSGKSLLSLIEDIMDVSKIEAEQLKIKNTPFSLNSLIDQLYAILSVHPTFLQKNSGKINIELLYDKPSENISIISDPDRLKQIFINLIGNALKFTQKGFILFGYKIENNEIVFYVKDTGIGIPADRTKEIFNRFSQVDNTLARKFGGSGLGLAISKGLLSLMNGVIWCESELGKGSSFYFTIPYLPAEVSTKIAQMQTTGEVDYQWSDHTVLIVEDDLINYKVIEAMLRRTNINIIHSDNGLSAIKNVYSNSNIDIVLMDIHLPEMNGLEATAKLLAINPTLPIIAQTANAMADDRDICIEAGCIDYISKPIDMNELFMKMAKYIS